MFSLNVDNSYRPDRAKDHVGVKWKECLNVLGRLEMKQEWSNDKENQTILLLGS